MQGQSEWPSLKENRDIRLYLCRRRDETDFPVEIDSCIAETVNTRSFEQGKIIKSKNINLFLKGQEDSDNYISVLVVGIGAKKEIDKLGPTKFHFVLVAEDARFKKEFEEECVRLSHDRPIITVASKETISRDIDDLLERISLAPLKVIGERCYEKFQQTAILADTSNGFHYVKSSNMTQTGSKGKTLANRTRLADAENCTSKHNGLHNTKPCDFQPSPSGNGFIKPEKTTFSIFVQQQNGRAVPDNIKQSLGGKTGKANTYDAKTKTILVHDSTIYTRSKRNGGAISMVNGSKVEIPNTKSSESKRIKRLLRQRSAETERATEQKDKRRKKELDCSDQIGLSDNEYQSSSSDHITEEENPERLLEAILAVYGMSNVPEAERPNVPKQSCIVSKEMRNELFKICPAIKRMGYRYRTFYIYAVKPKSQREEVKRRTQICSVLKRYGICHFKISPCAENVTKLMHVGAKIQVRPRQVYSLRSQGQTSTWAGKGGTLGCFVDMNAGEGQCGLLSKHVTEHVSDVYYVGQGGERKIGHMLEDTNRHQDKGLDISAALISEHIDENGTKFKDTRQNLLKGQLHEYSEEVDDAICRSGQSVHIYGANSNPGKGEITMTRLESGLSTTLIQVEDQISGSGTVEGHFADSGDSGAIVCVEDPEGKKVHALSMVMGTDLKETARRKYLTIPLSKGLKQLEDNTGKTFKLY